MKLEMTTEEQAPSSDVHHINGTEDNNTNDHDDETTTTTTSDTSSGPPARRSRFFRSKRKQRLNEEQFQQVDGTSDAPDEPADSSESPEHSTEEKHIEKTSVEEISTTDTNATIGTRLTRCSSPPPPPPSTDDTDEPDGNATSKDHRFSLSSEAFSTEREAYVTKKSPHENNFQTQSRPSLPTIYSGYQRKKSQSVKLTRIDPGDACPKKAVRFADDFGLDLSQIKMIKSDELPQVPIAAFKDLNINIDEISSSSFSQERMKTITYLEQQFENPIHAHGFEDRVSRHKIVLEQANAIDNRIYGTIKIVSLGLNKRVKIRLTTDNWITYNDYDATYITNSFDGSHDRFTFTLDIDRDRISVGNSMQFCLSYESYTGAEYWDSNYQQNYRFDCVSRSIPDYSS